MVANRKSVRLGVGLELRMIEDGPLEGLPFGFWQIDRNLDVRLAPAFQEGRAKDLRPDLNITTKFVKDPGSEDDAHSDLTSVI